MVHKIEFSEFDPGYFPWTFPQDWS